MNSNSINPNVVSCIWHFREGTGAMWAAPPGLLLPEGLNLLSEIHNNLLVAKKKGGKKMLYKPTLPDSVIQK